MENNAAGAHRYLRTDLKADESPGFVTRFVTKAPSGCFARERLEMGRPRIHANAASRQAAYRKRRRAGQSSAGEQQPGTFQAPFVVMGQSGRPILEVAEEDGCPVLRLFGIDGKTSVMLASAAYGGIVSLGEGDRVGLVTLYCEDGSGRMELYEPPAA